MERKIESRQITSIISMFMIAQLLGLLLTIVSYSPFASYAAQASMQQTGAVSSIVSFIMNVAVVVVIIVFVLLILNFRRGDVLYRLLEAYIILLGSFFLFLILLGDFLPASDIAEIAVASGILALLVLLFKQKTNRFRNLVTMITVIGVGVFFGVSLGISVGFIWLYLFFAAFAVYDYLAVFVLKFMIPFAREASSRNLAFLIGSSDVELIPLHELSLKDRAEYRKEKKKLGLKSIKDPAVKRLIQEGNVPAVSSIMLGNGDIMLPMMLTVGVYALYGSLFVCLIMVLGAVAGLYVTMLLLKRYNVGLPAIPPLFTFMSIALFIAFLIKGIGSSSILLLFIFAAAISIGAMLITLKRMRTSMQNLSSRKA